MCIEFHSPSNKEIQEWIIGISFIILFTIAVWEEKSERNWKWQFTDVIKRRGEQKGVNKYFFIVQRTINYLFRGFIVRQIFNPYFLFPFLILLFWFLRLNNIGNSDLILTLTLIVILWYSKETFVLRQSQDESNEISIRSISLSMMPGLTMRWYRPNGADWILILSNQGKGTALNIQASIEGHWKDKWSLELEGVNAINSGDTVHVGIKNQLNQILTTEQTSALSEKPLKIRIIFGSAENLLPTLSTLVEIKNPPDSKIIETKWGIAAS
jgi:hypothetical protein